MSLDSSPASIIRSEPVALKKLSCCTPGTLHRPHEYQPATLLGEGERTRLAPVCAKQVLGNARTSGRQELLISFSRYLADRDICGVTLSIPSSWSYDAPLVAF